MGKLSGKYMMALIILGVLLGVAFSIFAIFVLRDAMFYAALMEGLELPKEFVFISPVLRLAPEITLISFLLVLVSIFLKAKETKSKE